jgi:putative phosphoesterase
VYRILAFSDTHGDSSLCFEWLEKIPKVDLILHAGDILRDAEDLSAVYPQTEYVSGNNDFARFAPSEKLLFCEKKKLFLTHGHNFGVKYGLRTLASAAFVKGAQICVFGHTHIPYCGYENGILMVNPGSSSGRFASAATCAIIELDQGKASADILTME